MSTGPEAKGIQPDLDNRSLNDQARGALYEAFGADPRIHELDLRGGVLLGQTLGTFYLEDFPEEGPERTQATEAAEVLQDLIGGQTIEGIAEVKYGNALRKATYILGSITASIAERQAIYSGDLLGELMDETQTQPSEATTFQKPEVVQTVSPAPKPKTAPAARKKTRKAPLAKLTTPNAEKKPRNTKKRFVPDEYTRALADATLAGLDSQGEFSFPIDAPCKFIDPDDMFVSGERAQQKNKKVCWGCSGRIACLGYALGRDEKFGIWGGMTEKERKALRHRMSDVRNWSEGVVAAVVDITPQDLPLANP